MLPLSLSPEVLVFIPQLIQTNYGVDRVRVMLFCTPSEHKCNGRKSKRAQQKKLPASVRFKNPLGIIIVADSITQNVIVASRQPKPISNKLNLLELFQVFFHRQLFRNLLVFAIAYAARFHLHKILGSYTTSCVRQWNPSLYYVVLRMLGQAPPHSITGKRSANQRSARAEFPTLMSLISSGTAISLIGGRGKYSFRLLMSAIARSVSPLLAVERPFTPVWHRR